MPLGGGLSLGLAAAGMIGSGYQAIKGAKDAKEAEKGLLSSIASQQVKTINKEVEQQLAEAQARQNAVSPAVKYGMAMAGQGMANIAAKAQRGAGSGADYLATLGAAQQRYNATGADLALQQAQFQQQQLQNVAAARGAMSAERDAMLESANAKNALYQNLYAGQMGAANQMYSQGLSGLAQSAASGANAAANMYQPMGPKTIGPKVEMSPIAGKTNINTFDSGSMIGPRIAASSLKTIPTSNLMSGVSSMPGNTNYLPTNISGATRNSNMSTNYPAFPGGFGWF
jgi:hypothetical protein